MARTKKTGVAKVHEAAPAYAGGFRAPATKKNLRLHQAKIDEARRVLGTVTETETIELALDLVVLRDELVAGVAAMYGAGLVDVFND